MTNAELIRLYRDGDQEALETLLTRYEIRIFIYLYRMLNHRSQAEDATQNTFVNMLEALPPYVEQGSFKSWVF